MVLLLIILLLCLEDEDYPLTLYLEEEKYSSVVLTFLYTVFLFSNSSFFIYCI